MTHFATSLFTLPLQHYSVPLLYPPMLFSGFLAGQTTRTRQPQQRQTLRLFSVLESTSKRLFPEELNVIYDSKCNVCKLEIDFLQRRDLKRTFDRNQSFPKLKFTDLESGDYNPNDPSNGGISYQQGMESIHAVTADGKVVTGVPVFTMAYQQVGLGWLFAATKIPFFNNILEAGYKIFAKHRTRITRGASVDKLVEAYEEQRSVQEQQRQAKRDCEVCQTKE